MSTNFNVKKMKGLIRFRRHTDAVDADNPPMISQSDVVMQKELVNDKLFIVFTCPVCGNGIALQQADLEKFIKLGSKVNSQ